MPMDDSLRPPRPARKPMDTLPDAGIDAQLKEFLQDANHNRAKGFTIPNVFVKLNQLSVTVVEIAERVGLLEHRVDRHGREIKSLKEMANYEGEMDTGQHSLAAISREVELQRAQRDAEHKAKAEDSVWWKRQMVMWGVGALGVVILQVLTAVISIAISKGGK